MVTTGKVPVITFVSLLMSPGDTDKRSNFLFNCHQEVLLMQVTAQPKKMG